MIPLHLHLCAAPLQLTLQHSLCLCWSAGNSCSFSPCLARKKLTPWCAYAPCTLPGSRCVGCCSVYMLRPPLVAVLGQGHGRRSAHTSSCSKGCTVWLRGHGVWLGVVQQALLRRLGVQCVQLFDRTKAWRPNQQRMQRAEGVVPACAHQSGSVSSTLQWLLAWLGHSFGCSCGRPAVVVVPLGCRCFPVRCRVGRLLRVAEPPYSTQLESHWSSTSPT